MLRAAVAAVAADGVAARRLERPAGGALGARRRRAGRRAAVGGLRPPHDEVDARGARVTRSVAWRWSPTSAPSTATMRSPVRSLASSAADRFATSPMTAPATPRWRLSAWTKARPRRLGVLAHVNRPRLAAQHELERGGRLAQQLPCAVGVAVAQLRVHAEDVVADVEAGGDARAVGLGEDRDAGEVRRAAAARLAVDDGATATPATPPTLVSFTSRL